MTARAPKYDAEELMGVVPADDKTPYDVREVIARVVDASDFLEFKARYAAETVCGHARIGGQIVGIIGNNGPIQPDGSAKAGQFIQLCDQSQTPIVFLAEHHRLYGRVAGRARRGRQAWLENDSSRRQCPRAQDHHRFGRQFRRGQLRHVRARL
jgi:hypothetical protein